MRQQPGISHLRKVPSLLERHAVVMMDMLVFTRGHRNLNRYIEAGRKCMAQAKPCIAVKGFHLLMVTAIYALLRARANLILMNIFHA